MVCYTSMCTGIEIRKELLYDRHTLPDAYIYENTVRCFQWHIITGLLERLDHFQRQPAVWGVLQNRYNANGRPPVARNTFPDTDFDEITDAYGVPDSQSVPLYAPNDLIVPERYGRDGTLVKMLGQDGCFCYAEVLTMPGYWKIPLVYIKRIEFESPFLFTKVVFVDRCRQHVTALEKVRDRWLVRSMNPATTGIHRPPYRRETPLGMFVLQEKKERMYYLEDGSDRIEGFALYANRFTAGGYLHGVAVEVPQTEVVEFCSGLGTIPESHMCVRNATSHAKFIYDWAPVEESLICVIE
ncbi:MAG: L,D-transpeptidase [Tannerellaceae bacterium]|nr:L,D-transpeptidase [Tannerellaceae bacterium]